MNSYIGRTSAIINWLDIFSKMGRAVMAKLVTSITWTFFFINIFREVPILISL